MEEVVPADACLLCEQCLIFVKGGWIVCYHWVGSHASVVSVNVVEYAAAKEVVQCGAHSFLDIV